MLRSNNTIPPFSLTACDLICPRSSVHKRQNCVPLIIPSLSPSLFFYAIFFPASIPTLLLLLHLLLLCGCYDNSSTAPFICWRPGLLFLYGECAPLTSIHNTLSANAVTEAIEELTSLCLQQRLPVPLVSLSSSSFFFCPLFISFWRRLLVTCQLFTLLPSQRFHLCVPPPSLSPVTHWLLRSSFFLPFFLPSRFPPPLLAPPVTAIAARLRIIYRNWSEQAASPLKPVEIASEGKPGGKVEGDLVCFSALLLPCFACRRIFSYAFSFFSFFFLVFLFFFFSFWWAGHRSGRKQDCLCRWKEGKEGSWCRTPAFRNARSGLRMVSPATPSFACFIPPSVLANSVSPPHPASNPHHLSPAAPPFLARSSSAAWRGRWFEWRL